MLGVALRDFRPAFGFLLWNTICFKIEQQFLGDTLNLGDKFLGDKFLGENCTILSDKFLGDKFGENKLKILGDKFVRFFSWALTISGASF